MDWSDDDIVIEVPDTSIPLIDVPNPTGVEILVVQGRDGSNAELSGSVPTYADLPTSLGEGDQGDAYLVETTGKLYMWNGFNWPAEENGVPFQGPQGDAGRGVAGISLVGNSLAFAMSDSTTDTVPVPSLAAAAASATAAANSATAASTSASTATTAKNDAVTAKGAAETAATNAGASATAADAAKTAAVNAKTSAESAATSAGGSATAASGSASAASTSATNASGSATAASGSASDALASKNAAAASQTSAASSASDATAAKTDAQSARDDAASSATAADASADAALISESNASTSASAASGSATAADNSATAADNSATAAATSATNAATSGTDAASSASDAATSETNAANSATNSAGSASAASTSETNSANSATASAASADEAEYWAGEAAETVGSGIPNATTSTKGGVQLSDTTGEVGGTWDHMVVNGWSSKADLVGGKVPVSQMPALATTESFVVADTAARLALTCETGDVAIQTGNPGRGSYILQGTDPSNSTDWVLMNTPDAAVSSVNGYSGAVVLGKSDVGLSNVDNTADSAKPVSSAQQTALDGKVPTTRTVSAGTGLTGGGDLSANRTLAVAYGTTGTTAAAGNDSRIVNATPNTRTISAGTGLTGGGDLTANRSLTVDFGSAAGKVTEGNDARLSDARTPTAHTHAAADVASGTLDVARIPVGTSGTTVAAGNDSRFSDQRVPTDGSVTSAKIADGSIVDADINASAAIAKSKLAGTVQTSLGKADTSVQQVGTSSVVYGTDGSGAQAVSYLAYGQTGGDDAYTIPLRDDSGRLQSAAPATGLDVMTLGATPADISIIGFGKDTVRAAGLGDNVFGVKLQRAIVVQSVTFRASTADASGNLVCEIRQNGSAVSGTSTSIAAANQVAGGTTSSLSASFAAGDILTIAVTAVGATPGKGLVADIKAVCA